MEGSRFVTHLANEEQMRAGARRGVWLYPPAGGTLYYLFILDPLIITPAKSTPATLITGYIFPNCVYPYAAGGSFGQYKMMQKTYKLTETLVNGYSFESAQQELSNEYQDDRV